MIAFFTGSVPGSLVTRPLSEARVVAGPCAPDEDEGKFCAESAAAATTSHTRAVEKTFIMVFGCGEEFQSRPSSEGEDRSRSLTCYSNPVSARIQIKKICGFATVKYLESTTYVFAIRVNQ